MPRKDWNLKSTWDEAYNKGGEGLWGHPSSRPEVRLHYHKGTREGKIAQQALNLEQYLTPASYGRRTLIVGGGFGWIAEYLAGLGFTSIVVVETSAYVMSELDSSDEAEIRAKCVLAGADIERENLIVATYSRGVRRPTTPAVQVINEDILTPEGRDAVTLAFGTPGTKPQVVVTEDVMTSLDDAECLILDAACYGWTPNPNPVVHAVTTLDPNATQDPEFNWKTLADWKTLIPGSIWLDINTGDWL